MATEQPRAVWCCSTCGAIYHKDYPRCPADGAEVVMADRDPLLGSQIGNYTIDGLIGEGGMARVYLAHHANLPNRRYAVKVLLGDHAASAAMRTRFTREAERASQLDHPNVVRVVDFGQTSHGLLYIVMDHVDGPSLVSLIDELPMPAARVVALSRAICQGLVYAHTAGIVHRDLKPENILVATGPDGPVPRIVDFGLALSVDQTDARLTESGMTMGTPAFAAPEQLAGKAIDHRADLYALGMTMFEMLTGGKPPFEGHILEVMSARTARDVPRVTERIPELAVPAELEDIVARLTRRRPTDRFASAQEVVDALDHVPLGREARRSTDRLAQRLATRSRRRWLVAAAVAACAAGGAAWYAASAGSGASGTSVAAARSVSATSGRSGDPGAAPGGSRRAGDSASAPAGSRGDGDSSSASAGSQGAGDSASAPGGSRGAGTSAPGGARGAGDSASPAGAGDSASAGGNAVSAAGAPGSGDSASAPGGSQSGGESARGAATPAPGGRDRDAGSPSPRQRHRPRGGRATVRAAPASSAPSAPTAVPAPEPDPRTPPPPAAAPPPAAPPPAAPPPAAPRPPLELRASLEGVDVSGSLPRGDVQRAVDRRWSAIARCVPASPDTVIAHFTIGETRRAQGVRATGSTPQVNACITAALSEARTEAAPDVGDVEVTVRIAFVVKT